MDLKFYRCSRCGQIAALVNETRVPLVCCAKPMKLLIPGVVDAVHEKHVPIVNYYDRRVNVKVGKLEHPMHADHFVQWIALETDKGCSIKKLNPGEKPEVDFYIDEGETVQGAYEFCNLHGLWKSEFTTE